MDIDGKLRPLYLLRILREQTDENHKLSTAQLCKLLKDEYGIDTFRTTIKTDIEVLQQAGYSIEVTRSSQNLYNYTEREFDTQEITAMLDAVLCSKIITRGSRDQIAGKLTRLAGPFRTQELKRNWINKELDPQDKEQIAVIVDTINEAINKRRKIRFRKFEYNVKKERTVINGGAPYVISPMRCSRIVTTYMWLAVRTRNKASACIVWIASLECQRFWMILQLRCLQGWTANALPSHLVLAAHYAQRLKCRSTTL